MTFNSLVSLALVLGCLSHFGTCRTYLQADGQSDTYRLIDTIFGYNQSATEVPDCNHTSFGPHITQIFDASVNSYAFAFHLHIREDDDRCLKFDRQRVEIKTNDKLSSSGESESELIARVGEFVTLSWDFKLDIGFQPPYSFCHIHQLKAVGGDDSLPLITITPRRSNPNELQLLQYDSDAKLNFLEIVPLKPFLGTWVHAVSNVTYGTNGSYSIELTRRSDGLRLLSYQTEDMDLWRNQTDFIRPKWGLYRSVQEAALSRDETVLFHNLCVGKGIDSICL